MGKQNNQKKFNKGSDSRDIKRKSRSKMEGEVAEKTYRPDQCVMTHAGKRNVFSWYNHFPQLLNDATKWNFFNQLGREISLGDKINFSVPGVCIMDLVNSVGYSRDTNSAISRASIQLFEEIRKNLNRATYNYGPGDLAVMFCCIADLHSQYANIMRAFGLFKQWQNDNLYLPRKMLMSLYGIDDNKYKTIAGSFANYRERFNVAIRMANWLEVPAGIDLVDRWSWPYEGVYRDSKATKGQTYGFRKVNYFKWDETGETGSFAESNEYEYTASNPLTHMLSAFEECTAALYNSESVRIMQADLRHAFGDNFAKVMVELTPDYEVVPTDKLDVVLSQIENCRIVAPIGDSARDNYIISFSIGQDPTNDAVISTPEWECGSVSTEGINATALAHDFFVNFHWDNPTVEDITEATRLTCGVHIEDRIIDDETKTYAMVVCGAQVCVGMRVFHMWDVPDYYRSSFLNADGIIAIGGLVGDASAINSFDWAPSVYVLYDEGTKAKPINLDFDNYSIADYSMLERLHEVCMLSLLDMPTAK